MAKKYLTLEEAAARLSMPKDELIRMREQGQVRGFADRGNWKFKVDDIETLARQRQADSDPETPILPDEDSGITTPPAEGELGLASGSGVINLGAGGLEAGGSDSDVRLVTESGISTGAQAPKGAGVEDDSDSDIQLKADAADSDSDVKLVDSDAQELEDDSDSDVKMVEDDSDSDVMMVEKHSDSDVKILPPKDSDSDITLATDGEQKESDSDVKLVGEDSGSDISLAPDEKTEKEIGLAGSESDVRLVPDTTAEGSDSDVQVVESSSAQDETSDSDIALIESGDAVPVHLSGRDQPDSVLADDESGISIAEGSSMTLGSDSGISLERPADSGIALDAGSDDEGITLAEDSGIALDSAGDSGIALAPLDDDLQQTKPLMDAVSAEKGGATHFEIPPVTEDDDEAFDFDDSPFEDEDTGMFDLEDEHSDEQTALVDVMEDSGEFDDAALAVEESGEISDELEFDHDFDSGSVEDLDVFEEEGDEYEEGFTSGVSHADFVAPVPRAAAVETEWGTGPFVGLLISTVLLMMVGIVMFDLVRSMWMWNEPTPLASALLNALGGLYK